MKTHIIKRRDHAQKYDEKKVYASVYSAALNCHWHEQDAEKLAEKVMREVNRWIGKKATVSSTDIRDQITNRIHDKDVAMMYAEHLDIC